MDNTDDVLRQRIATFAKGILYTRDDFLHLIHVYSLEKLALIVIAYGHEALAALRNPERANKRVLEFVGAIHDCLSAEDRVTFSAGLETALEQCQARDEGLLRQLPIFEYEVSGGVLGVRIIFPDPSEA